MADKIKKTLTDDNIKALKAAPDGKRYDAWDITVPGLSVRVTDSGTKTFSVTGRLFNEATARRFTIGKVGLISLAAARETAREYLKLLGDKKDPRIVATVKEAEAVKEATDDERRRFCNVKTEYEAVKKRLMKAHPFYQMGLTLKRECMPLWKDRDVRSITTEEVSALIRGKAKTHPGAAQQLYSILKTFFAWTTSNGITPHSPAAVIKGKDVAGPRSFREHTLSVEELRKLWHLDRYLNDLVLVAITRMLILTGCRLMEVVEAKWREIDLDAKLWKIPKGRMKMKKEHVVPLTPLMIKVLRSLRRGKPDDYVFSLDGIHPMNHAGRAKHKIDDAVGFTDWVNHDCRRTLCTMVTSIGVLPHIAELMIAHTKKGYNQHDYLEEKTAGFRLWDAEVARIVGPQLEVVRKRAA